MLKKTLISAFALLASGTTAFAQFGGYGYGGLGGYGYGGLGGYGYGGMGGYGGGMGGYGGGVGGMSGLMPNIYNPQTQPLSPYLNMFRGSSNPAANYYFGTRPGTVGGGRGYGFGGAPNMAFGGNRMPFFPQQAMAPEPLALPEADPGTGTVLPPAGHPVLFSNTLGYYPMPYWMYRRGMSGRGMGGLGGMGRGGPGGMSGSRQQGSTPRR